MKKSRMVIKFDPYGTLLLVCFRLSDSGEDTKEKAREKLAGRKKEKEEKERKREPVIISFTTLFRPLLVRLRLLDFRC